VGGNPILLVDPFGKSANSAKSPADCLEEFAEKLLNSLSELAKKIGIPFVKDFAGCMVLTGGICLFATKSPSCLGITLTICSGLVGIIDISNFGDYWVENRAAMEKAKKDYVDCLCEARMSE